MRLAGAALSGVVELGESETMEPIKQKVFRSDGCDHGGRSARVPRRGVRGAEEHRVVNARMGLHQQWMSLMGAKDRVKKAKGFYLRE